MNKPTTPTSAVSDPNRPLDPASIREIIEILFASIAEMRQEISDLEEDNLKLNFELAEVLES